MLYNIILIVIGLFVSRILFYRFPHLTKSDGIVCERRLSVIIPSRNEADNLPLLIRDLKNQNYPIYEIICVDDCSTDNTAVVASSYGVKLVSVSDKPSDWTGKAFACQQGALAAQGELYLFLDADVRLSKNAISELMRTYDEKQCIISVQPYHQTVKNYEQFSLFFNLVQVPSNGTGTLINFKNAGLYGPVILIDKASYWSVEGHTAAKSSIVDDVALGEALARKGIQFKLLLGAEQISFRMYAGGFKDLLQGWTKNYATGALKTTPLLFIMVFMWIASGLSVFINAVSMLLSCEWLVFSGFVFLYWLWVMELFRISGKIGRFQRNAIIIFPLYLIFFISIFIVSFIKKLFRLNVTWKGRKIKLVK